MPNHKFSAVPVGLPAMISLLTVLSFLVAAPAMGQAVTTLHHFQVQGGSTDPTGLLLSDAAGNLYGVTSDDAIVNGFGTVFELSPPATGGAWTYTALYHFAGGTDGHSPTGSLIADAAGNLYGTTAWGGTPNNYGTVFELIRPTTSGGTWSENVLYRFQGGTTDGDMASSGVVMDAAGNLYGETTYGGACDDGTVYELSPPASQGGSWTEMILYSFQYDCHGDDGSEPSGGLTVGKNGVMYGITDFGSTISSEGGSLGVVFSLHPPAAGQTQWTERIIYGFTAGVSGYNPYGGVTEDGKGNLYGTTFFGGDGSACEGGCGQVYQLSPRADGAWTFNTLYSFDAGMDGLYPVSKVTFDKAGNLYATSGPGALGCGTIIQLTPPSTQGGTWTETNIHPFACILSDEGRDYAGLISGKNGALYGVASGSGSVKPPQYGTVFKFVP